MLNKLDTGVLELED